MQDTILLEHKTIIYLPIFFNASYRYFILLSSLKSYKSIYQLL
ncbi:hypothetical protein HMPREF9555_00374 [Selenomonas artemidis F0399]|uniref:Uncharacterized protein n=1 Tax=Selenomonas artemidis F0399 TaxID=749551 RepID=E7N082_9FIRM|nr:hypothetical protein HMPREF9555_00374 [Selenomonas artemidis F0399]